MNHPRVIAVSGVSGSGKNTITGELSRRIPQSAIISFDDIQGDLLGMDYCDWSEAGADYNQWNLTALEKQLLSKFIPEYKNIFLDYPFGYGNRRIAAYIDTAIFIDIPLDIALARQLIRDYGERDSSRRPIKDPMQAANTYLKFYLQRHRDTYIQHINTVKPYVDYVVDGTLPLHRIIDEIMIMLSY